MKLKQDDFRVSMMQKDDLEEVCHLLNKMWEGNGLYVKYTPQLLEEEIQRIPGLDYDSINLLWKDNKLCSCIALWD